MERITDEIFDFANRAMEKGKEAGQIGMKRLDRQVKITEMQRAASRLGTLVFERFESNDEITIRRDDPDLSELISKISTLDDQVDALEKEIEDLRNE